MSSSPLSKCHQPFYACAPPAGFRKRINATQDRGCGKPFSTPYLIGKLSVLHLFMWNEYPVSNLLIYMVGPIMLLVNGEHHDAHNKNATVMLLNVMKW